MKIPEDNKTDLVSLLKWYILGIPISNFIYGEMMGRRARKNISTGEVQIYIGNNNYATTYSSWWPRFKPKNTAG